MAAPLQDGAHRIGARDEVQRNVFWVVRAQLPQRVSRVRDARSVNLDAADIERGVRSNGQLAHAQALLGAGNVALQLERRHARRDEHHRVKAECLARLLGAGQMPDVHGVERTAHDAQTRRRTVSAQVVETMAHHRPAGEASLIRSRHHAAHFGSAYLTRVCPRHELAPFRAARTCTK